MSASWVDRWIAAWTHVRGLEVSDVDGWPLVHVRSRTRETEIVCDDPGSGTFRELMAQIAGDPRAMLTVVAPDITAYGEVTLPAGVRVDRDDETFMTTALLHAPLREVDTSFTPRWDVEDHRTTYALEHDGRIAAEGVVGVLGSDAVWDAVETTPAYQRRGLGRHVMIALTNRAIDEGATTGLLAATASGRRLYESLGWDATYAMRSLMGTSLDG